MTAEQRAHAQTLRRAAERAVNVAERAVEAARSDWEDELAAGELRAAIAWCRMLYDYDAIARS